MERITEHHLRIIRISIIAFAAISIVGFCYEIGEDLYLLRQPRSKFLNKAFVSFI